MKFSHNWILFFLVFSVSAGFSFAQDKKEKKSKQKEQSSVQVRANVLVRDLSGNLADIKTEDLKIYEDDVEQKITYFAKKEPILNLGFVFDNTGSMRRNLDKIINIPFIFTDNLNAKDEAFVVRFVDSDKIEVIQEWTSDKTALIESIENLYVEGGQSAVLDAVYLSAEKILDRERKDKTKRYGIILFSDAEERESYYNLKEIKKLFTETDLQIFILSFAETAPLNKKKSRFISNILALETGGTAHALPKKHSKEDLIYALKNIFDELRSQYIIRYISTNQKRDGLPRKLRVEVADSEKGEKRQAFIRESFIVSEN